MMLLLALKLFECVRLLLLLQKKLLLLQQLLFGEPRRDDVEAAARRTKELPQFLFRGGEAIHERRPSTLSR